jgi:hypothetical protein
MQGDLVCVDLQKCKQSVLIDITTLLKSYALPSKVALCNLITCILATGFDDFGSCSHDLVGCLNQVFNDADEI